MKKDKTEKNLTPANAGKDVEEIQPEAVPGAVVDEYVTVAGHSEIIGLKKEIDELLQDRDREKDLRLRIIAEYDNYRRRTTQEIAALTQAANERLIVKLLPVVDDFGRFLSQNLEAVDCQALARGVELIARKFEEVMVAEGVQPIPALGQPFDAQAHEAIAQIEDPAKANGIVLIEVERGYRLGGKIIRHPKVVVNNLTEKPEASGNRS